MDFITSMILLQNVCSYKYQFCKKVSGSSRLVSQVHMTTGQNIKKNVPYVSDPNQNVEKTCNSKVTFT